MADSFAVHLGGGAYLDASGKIIFGAPDNAQIYQAPGGFRLDTKKIQEAFKDLSGKAEVVALIGEAVARVNEGLPEAARIREFALFDKELDADDDELTRTNKVRRATILAKYGHLIDRLYPGPRSAEMLARG